MKWGAGRTGRPARFRRRRLADGREGVQQLENGPSLSGAREQAGTGLEAEGRYPCLTFFSRSEGLMPQAKKARAVGFNHIALEVGDIEKALSFYSRIFEFQLRGKNEDMAFLMAPFNFQAVGQGFKFGLAIDYIMDLPLSGIVVNVNWAKAHRDLLQQVLRAYARGTTFFEDVNNRDESMRILQAAGRDSSL
jgi:ABC-type nitrate/sulfonate/bicarbonate transport system substrate-binding protein